jgi:hypothetical protein
MWYNPAAFLLDRRDVIGAWLICGAIAAAFFGYPAVTSALDTWAGTAPLRPPVACLGAYQRATGRLSHRLEQGVHPVQRGPLTV